MPMHEHCRICKLTALDFPWEIVGHILEYDSDNEYVHIGELLVKPLFIMRMNEQVLALDFIEVEDNSR
jgi:hypothetical protein